MNSNEIIVKKILEQIGCTVEKIPESRVKGEKRPDFYAILGGDNYIIEQKTKDISEEALEKMRAKMDEKGVISEAIPMERQTRYSRRIKDSVEQLQACKKEGFKISWFHNVGIEASNHKDNFKYALYGIQILSDFTPSGTARECFFFNQSDFYRYRDVIDAAIVAVDNGETAELEMYLNPLSKNYKTIKDSALCKIFIDKGVMVDPLMLDEQGDIFYADEKAGNNSDEIIENMKKKYGCKQLVSIPMQIITARMIVPSK